jgi:hypothetical protein
MSAFPQGKVAWLKWILLPLKILAVWTAMGVLFGFSSRESYDVFILSSFFSSFLLLLAALIFSLTGPKGFAFSCAGFGAISFLAFCLLISQLPK